MKKDFMSRIVITFFMLIVFQTRAYAYLDPGSGSYLFQIMLASFVGAAFAVKAYWIQIKNFSRSCFIKTHHELARVGF